MDKSELIRMAANKAQEQGAKMNVKPWVMLAVAGLVLLVGFIAYRLILVEVITSLRDHD